MIQWDVLTPKFNPKIWYIDVIGAFDTHISGTEWRKACSNLDHGQSNAVQSGPFHF